MTDVVANKEFIDLLLYLFIGFGIAFFALLGAWGYDSFRRTPKVAKTMKAAYNQHRGLLATQTDQGKIKFRVGFKILPEGIVEAKPEGPKPKKAWTGLFARKVDVPKLEAISHSMTNGGDPDKDKKAEELKLQISQLLSDQATTPTIIEGGEIPIAFGYDGKGILTRIGHLASLKVLERVKEFFPDAIIGVDFTTLKTLFSQPWDETQIDAMNEKKKQEGIWIGRRGEDKNREVKILLMLMFGVFGMAALAVLIYKFL